MARSLAFRRSLKRQNSANLIATLVVVTFVTCIGQLACAVDEDPSAPGRDRKKNVLLIVADDLTANALGCYGNKHCKTPNIDRLARAGLRFENAYCQFPVCGPSRAAMMSGMYCQSLGMKGNGSSGQFTQNLGDRPSMAEHFKDHGWYTARVSKIYHMRVPGDITAGVDGPDHLASWTERFNCRAPEWMSKGKHEHFTKEKLKRLPDKHYGLGFGSAFYSVRTEDPDGTKQADKLAADKAIELLKTKSDKPFFLAVGLVRPHVPLVSPPKYYELHPHRSMKLPKKVEGDWDDIPKIGITKNSKGSGLDGDLQKQRKVLQAYYAAVAFMDFQVGRILDELDRQKLRENTIVIFKSDHGHHLGEHDLWQKLSLHEESARIPLIVAAPGSAIGSSTSLVEAIDLYPTLAEQCGLDIPAHCEGKSLSPLLQDPKKKVRDSAFCMTAKGVLLRTKDWALIRYKDGSEELYDMKQDPKQYRNLASESSSAKVLETLRQQLENRSEGDFRK